MLTYRDLFDLSIGEGNLSHFFVYSILLSWYFKPLIFRMNQYINKDKKLTILRGFLFLVDLRRKKTRTRNHLLKKHWYRLNVMEKINLGSTNVPNSSFMPWTENYTLLNFKQLPPKKSRVYFFLNLFTVHAWKCRIRVAGLCTVRKEIQIFAI